MLPRFGYRLSEEVVAVEAPIRFHRIPVLEVVQEDGALKCLWSLFLVRH